MSACPSDRTAFSARLMSQFRNAFDALPSAPVTPPWSDPAASTEQSRTTTPLTGPSRPIEIPRRGTAVGDDLDVVHQDVGVVDVDAPPDSDAGDDLPWERGVHVPVD